MNKHLHEAGVRGGNAPKHKWTEEERDYVRRYYRGNNQSAIEIAHVLKVTPCAVKGQVQSMGIAKRQRYPPWTKARDRQLKKLARTYAPRTIALKMKRSMNSIVLRMKRIQIYRRYRDGWYTKKDVCEILGVDHKWVQDRIDNGSLVAAHHDPHSPPQKNGAGCWHIEQDALYNFIRKYPEELNGRNVDMIQIVEILVGLNNNH